mgnify:CR=1 FL=1
MGFYSCLDSGILLDRLCLASEVSRVIAFLDNDLITASSEGYIDRASCLLGILNIVMGTVTDTHRNCQCQLIADVDRLDVLKQGELTCLQRVKRAFSNKEEILILFGLSNDTVAVIGHIFSQTAVICCLKSC